jgi:hypothetical protein
MDGHRTPCGECTRLFSNHSSTHRILWRHINPLQAGFPSPILDATCVLVVTRVAGRSSATARSPLDWPVEERRQTCGTPPLHLPTRFRMTAKPSPWSHHRFMTQCKYNDMRGKWAKPRQFDHCVVQLAAQCVDPRTSISPFLSTIATPCSNQHNLQPS